MDTKQLIQQAAQLAYDNGVVADITPMCEFLATTKWRPLAACWEFLFCVCCAVADLRAQAEGYASQGHRAAARITRTLETHPYGKF